MKKNLTVFFLTVILLTSAINVYAVNEHANENGKEHGSVSFEAGKHENSGKNEDHNKNDDDLIVPTVIPTQAPTENDDCEENVKNHGEYVSCVAHRHEGGKVVSEAAHSSTGKKDHSDDGDENEPTPTLTPTPTSTLTPSPTPTEILIVIPTITEISEEEGNQIGPEIAEQIKELIDELKELIIFLTSIVNT